METEGAREQERADDGSPPPAPHVVPSVAECNPGGGTGGSIRKGSEGEEAPAKVQLPRWVEILSVLSLALATSAAVYSAYVARQQWATEIDNVEAAQQATLLATIDSKRSREQSIEALMASQRAWVSQRAVNQQIDTATGERKVSVTFTNTGETPALEFRSAISVGDTATAGPDEAAMGSAVTQEPPTSATLGPGAEVAVSFDFKPTQIASGKRFFYYACGEYKDIFGRAHFVEHCGLYNTQTGSFQTCSGFTGIDMDLGDTCRWPIDGGGHDRGARGLGNGPK